MKITKVTIFGRKKIWDNWLLNNKEGCCEMLYSNQYQWTEGQLQKERNENRGTYQKQEVHYGISSEANLVKCMTRI
jgi:hypothetical protein